MICSVVVPTYNRKESLRRTLDALALQTVPKSDFEVIVVSDGSTDGTDALLDEYAAKGTLTLRWFTQKNAGPAAARNHGIEKATSEIICFADDDVEPVPQWMELHLRHHPDDEKVVVLGPLSPNPRWTPEEPAWIAWEHAKLQDIYTLFKTGEFAGKNAGYVHFYSGNASIRRRWLIEAGGFNTEFKRQEDVELAERLKRLCGVRFKWDFDADGLHHPVRTLESWLRIPTAYGTLDAERVRSGTLTEDRVGKNVGSRHKATQALTRVYEALPPAIEPLSRVLCRGASAAYGAGMKSAGLSVLSAVYNARYTAAYQARMKRA